VALKNASKSLKITNKLLAEVDDFDKHWEWWLNLSKSWRVFYIKEVLKVDLSEEELFDKSLMYGHISKILDLTEIVIYPREWTYHPSQNPFIENLDNPFLSQVPTNEKQIRFIDELLKSKPLSYLTKIEKLSFGRVRIPTLEIFNKILTLKDLYIDTEYTIDLTPIKNLRNLEVLTVNNNHIKDIRFLESLNKLKEVSFNVTRGFDFFSLENNYLTDINPLRNLINLQSLKIVTASNDLNPISELLNLKKLNLTLLKESSLTSLSDLHNLNELSIALNDNSQFDLNFLNSLNNIKYLKINYRKLNIQTLPSLKKLTILDLSKQKLNNITTIEKFDNLEELDLSNNAIYDIIPLARIKSLKKIIIYQNPILQKDIDWLRQQLPNCIIHF
jgi:internalin A